jgi:hypothetical protein
MVPAWAKKAVDAAPLCGKATNIMPSATTHGRSENGVVLCKPRAILFPVKGYSASICISSSYNMAPHAETK